MKKHIFIIVIMIAIIILSAMTMQSTMTFRKAEGQIEIEVIDKKKKSSIKWAEFNVSAEMLNKAYEYDMKSKGDSNWINILAYSMAKNWGNADSKCIEYIDEAAKIDFKNFDEEELKYYKYYKEVYTAILGGFIGENTEGYGLCVYSPVPKNFEYTHYDDFGDKRTYGYKRTHTGNDIIGASGTPVICVESGTVEALGWNMYGGWRIGIRSKDKKRYYYYAHLKKDHPYCGNIKEGDEIKAGDVIGYLGMTGYSKKENVNNLKIPHLHFGISISFENDNKDEDKEVWIDAYNLVNFLDRNKSEVKYDEKKKEYIRSGN